MERGHGQDPGEGVGGGPASISEKAERGEATFADADGIVLDLVEAIGRGAEEGGWYSDWAAMMGWSDAAEGGQGL